MRRDGNEARERERARARERTHKVLPELVEVLDNGDVADKVLVGKADVLARPERDELRVKQLGLAFDERWADEAEVELVQALDGCRLLRARPDRHRCAQGRGVSQGGAGGER